MQDENINKIRELFYEYNRRSDYINAIIAGEKLLFLYRLQNVTGGKVLSDDIFRLAYIYDRLNRTDRASQLYKKSLSATYAARGNSIELSDRMTNLAICYAKLGKYSDATGLHSESYAIRKRLLGESHSSTIDSLYNLANTHYDSGNYESAVTCHKKAAKYRNGMALADSLNSLGYCYEKTNDYENAIVCFEQALTIIEEISGKESTDYMANILYAANAAKINGDYARAYKYYGKGARLIKKNLSDTHPYYSRALNHISEYYSFVGNVGKAASLKLRALRVLEKSIGTYHLFYANNLKNIAFIYHSIGKNKQCIKLILESLSIKEVLIGVGNDEYLRDCLSFFNILLNIAQYDTIQKICKKLLAHYNIADCYGSLQEFNDTVNSLSNCGNGNEILLKKAYSLLDILNEKIFSPAFEL